VSKHKGVISIKLMAEGEAWADYAIFETMDDLNAFLKSAEEAQTNGTNALSEKLKKPRSRANAGLLGI